jgi:hypothetical protein
MTELKIYKIKQNINNGWDTYSDAVVIAENEEEAKKMHPDNYVWTEKGWVYINDKKEEIMMNEKGYCYQDWIDVSQIDKVEVEYIGEAKEESEKGVVCASFHAG